MQGACQPVFGRFAALWRAEITLCDAMRQSAGPRDADADEKCQVRDAVTALVMGWRRRGEGRIARAWSGCCVMRKVVQCVMIEPFRHKGLRTFFETGSASGIQASHVKRLRMQLAALDTAKIIDDMDIPGFRLHPLRGRMQGRWSVTVNGNWRLTFEFRDGNAYVLDYEDYH